ncbi:hypothetical protein FEM48_Zijuj09G0196800 [Ziziphus jujuba var. spinosa]|uniref:Uncharacterized protein n=1 Tax=Ziziphus jujuba var. spinosa TaxID=714518 RepID=A0A978UUY2_ZIZJJ|nr:hypothetical protein FEM48_Zijuj09G0196800 [Ziziphus jujuba var. spinosa]
MCGAPVVLNMLSNSPDNEPLKNPVNILPAEDPPPSAVLPRTEYLGFVVSHGYRLTETAGLGMSCAWKPEWNRLPASERARLKARQVVRLAGMTRIDVLDPNTGEASEDLHRKDPEVYSKRNRKIHGLRRNQTELDIGY